MVKISELANGAGIGGTEQVPVNDGGTTVKYTVDEILARTHTHTASQITDFDTEVSNNTTVTTLVSDLNTAEGTISTHTTDIAGKLGNTELRTGLTANKLLATDGSGNEGYTDAASMASDAEFYTGTNATKYTNPQQVQSMFTIIAGTNLFVSADTERTTASATYTKLKEVEIEKTGTYTIEFDIKHSGAGTSTQGQIYKNGVAFGTNRTTVGTTYVTHTEDLAFTKNDLIQLYIKNTTSGTAYCRNFRIKGAVAVNPEGIPDAYVGTVNTD